MPLTNEAVIPIGMKDFLEFTHSHIRTALISTITSVIRNWACTWMTTYFGGTVPAMSALRIQHASPTLLGNVDFGNTHDGLYVLYGNAATTERHWTLLSSENIYCVRANHVLPTCFRFLHRCTRPPLSAGHLGKTAGNPLTAGKPFINNFSDFWWYVTSEYGRACNGPHISWFQFRRYYQCRCPV